MPEKGVFTKVLSRRSASLFRGSTRILVESPMSLQKNILNDRYRPSASCNRGHLVCPYLPVPPSHQRILLVSEKKLTFIVSHMKFLWTFQMPFGKICQMVDRLRYIRLTHALFVAPNFPSRQPYRIPEPVRENIQKPCLHKNFLWTFRVLFGKLLPSVEDA
jgi:hypothetical protein